MSYQETIELVPRSRLHLLNLSELQELDQRYSIMAALFQAESNVASARTALRRRREVRQAIRAIQPSLWRLTLAINFVVHYSYYSITLQKWHTDRALLEAQIQELTKRLRYALTRYLGYPPSEWWFSDIPAIELEEVPFESRLIDKEEILVEELS